MLWLFPAVFQCSSVSTLTGRSCQKPTLTTNTFRAKEAKIRAYLEVVAYLRQATARMITSPKPMPMQHDIPSLQICRPQNADSMVTKSRRCDEMYSDHVWIEISSETFKKWSAIAYDRTWVCIQCEPFKICIFMWLHCKRSKTNLIHISGNCPNILEMRTRAVVRMKRLQNLWPSSSWEAVSYKWTQHWWKTYKKYCQSDVASNQ